MDIRPKRMTLRLGLMAAGALGCAMFYSVAMAQETAAGSPAGAVEGVEMGKGVPTVAALFMTSPYINGGLLILSVIALLLFLFMLLSLTSASFTPSRFVDNVTKLILNRQFDQAVHLCQSNSGVFASSIIQRVIENRDKEHGELMEILSAEGRRRGETIWNRVSYLSEISNIAPMLGLLGTVVGMIKVFFTLTERIAGPNVDRLSAGIAEAMGTTMFGLIVAIAAGVFYTLARSRAVKVLAEAEQVCHTIVDHTHRSASDPRLKKIDALADAARKKLHTRGAPAPSSAQPGTKPASGGGGDA